ncbi:MAG TPA: glycosyltransferase family 2 protein [Vicinamibacterales bacterium]|nr:glycosyltransferase family 2 protein [Vicinamibacterales bacterium]
MSATPSVDGPLRTLTVVIPARDEEGSVGEMVRHLHCELASRSIAHEIIVVDDGSADATAAVVLGLADSIPQLKLVRNEGPHGFGRAVVTGIDAATGDAVVIMMADESDDCRDVVGYWEKLGEGYDAVFGSRFVAGAQAIDYPLPKYLLNRAFNFGLRVMFGYRYNDTTNAFKAYRRRTLDGLRPFLAPHFNLTVELPLKVIVRGYSWTVVPISWRNRRTGVAKLKIKEMGARYMFIVLYVWLEKYFSRGDFRKPPASG